MTNIKGGLHSFFYLDDLAKENFRTVGQKKKEVGCMKTQLPQK